MKHYKMYPDTMDLRLLLSFVACLLFLLPLNAQSKTIRAFFIGNSYTNTHNLPEIVKQIAATATDPDDIIVDMKTYGGQDLKYHWEYQVDWALTTREKIAETGPWDYIVMQPYWLYTQEVDSEKADPEVFYKYARLWDEYNISQGAKSIIWTPWTPNWYMPRKLVLYTKNVNAIKKICDERNIPNSYVGQSFWEWEERNVENHQDPGVLDWDGNHVRITGAYFAACSIYITLTEGKSPVGSTYLPEGLSESDARMYQQLAWDVYQKLSGENPDKPGTEQSKTLLIDFGSQNSPSDYGWNNVTDAIGSVEGTQLTHLINEDGEETDIGLQILSRFNGANTNGTSNSEHFTFSATSDSLYGNTENWGGLTNVHPSFKLTDLNPKQKYRLSFYASRLGVSDVRETRYTIVGQDTTVLALDPANNIDGIVTTAADGILADANNEITISLAPGGNNTNGYHFIYLGAMKVEVIGDGGDPDITEPPAAPTNLTSPQKTAESITLSWQPSEDTGNTIASYVIYQDGSYAGSVDGNTTSCTLTGLRPDTEYTFSVTAKNAAGNESQGSNILKVKTESKTEPPSGLNLGKMEIFYVSDSWMQVSFGKAEIVEQVFLEFDSESWEFGTYSDNDTCFALGHGGIPINEQVRLRFVLHSGETAFTQPFLLERVGYPGYAVELENGGDDINPPTTPSGLTSPAKTENSVTLSWQPSEDDDSGVAGYIIHVYHNEDVRLISVDTTTNYTVTGLEVDTEYIFTIKALDAAGNRSLPSDTLYVRTAAGSGDIIPPTVPSGLTSTAKTDTSVTLSWQPSEDDDSGVAGYNILQDGTPVLSVGGTTTTSTITGLTANTEYAFSVTAKDAAGNESEASDIVIVMTEESGPRPQNDLIIITPSITAVKLDESLQFAAAVTGMPDERVNWSVLEHGYGEIDQNGNYKAPAVLSVEAPRTLHVLATSVSDGQVKGTATIRLITPNEKAAITKTGRFNWDGTSSWPGSSMRAFFRGTNINVHLSRRADVSKFIEPETPSENNFLNVNIDNTIIKTIKIDGEGNILLADGLSNGVHYVEISRQDEARYGSLLFDYLYVSDGGGLINAAPEPSTKRIEFIGDSITCGSGNEASNEFSESTAENGNNYMAYGAIAARMLRADQHTICWSGKGLYKNADGSTEWTLPDLYRLDQTNEGSLWKAEDSEGNAHIRFDIWKSSDWIPHVVVINLGMNDIASGADRDEFISAYKKFISSIRSRYSYGRDVHIYCTVGPMLSGSELNRMREWVRDGVVNNLIKAGDSKIHFLEFGQRLEQEGYGAEYHPSIQTHKRMANELVDRINNDSIPFTTPPAPITNPTDGTKVSGEINQDTTFTKENSPYYITGDVWVKHGARLTIEPGVKVIFLGHHRLTVNGSIDARGTADDRILFTAANKIDGWYGIRIWGGNKTGVYGIPDLVDQYLEYCTFEYANKINTESTDPDYKNGNGYSGIRGGALVIDFDYKLLPAGKNIGELYHINNNIFRYNKALSCGGAMSVVFMNGSMLMENNIFEYNYSQHQGGALAATHTAYPILKHCTFRNNAADGAYFQRAFALGTGGAFREFEGGFILEDTVIENNFPDTFGGGHKFDMDGNPYTGPDSGGYYTYR